MPTHSCIHYTHQFVIAGAAGYLTINTFVPSIALIKITKEGTALHNLTQVFDLNDGGASLVIGTGAIDTSFAIEYLFVRADASALLNAIYTVQVAIAIFGICYICGACGLRAGIIIAIVAIHS